MKNPIGIGLAIAATAALASAHGEGDGKGNDGKPGGPNHLFQEGLKITYKPGSGVTFDGGDEFRLNVGGRIQVRWAYSNVEMAEDINTFGVRRARTKWSGHVFSEDVTFYLQNDHTGGTSVLDAWMGWRFLNNDDHTINLRVGLQKMRNSLQWSNSSASLEFPERALATRTFADERATGALVEGQLMKTETGGRLHWHVGAFNNDVSAGWPTAAAEAPNDSNELNYIFGAMWNVRGGGSAEKWTEGDLDHSGELDAVVGANLALLNDRLGGTDLESTLINVHAGVKSGSGIAAQGEVWLRTDEAETGPGEVDSQGWYVQGSFTTAPGEGTQWGFAGRVGMVTVDDPLPAGFGFPARPGQPGFDQVLMAFTEGEVLEANLAANAYYHKHKLKTQIAYTYMDTDPESGAGVETTNHGIDIMFTLLF